MHLETSRQAVQFIDSLIFIHLLISNIIIVKTMSLFTIILDKKISMETLQLFMKQRIPVCVKTMDNNNCYLGIAVIPFTILSLYLVSGYAIYALISNDARLE